MASPEEIERLNNAPCGQCQHPDGPHVLVATEGDPLYGGIRLCPHPWCQCFATWSREGAGRDTVTVPDELEVARIRAGVQGINLLKRIVRAKDG